MLSTLPSVASRLATTVLLLGLASTANAGIITATTMLDESQNVDPSNPDPSTATGSATLLFDTDTGLLSISASISGVSIADITFTSGGLVFDGAGPLHIHTGAAGTNGPVVVPFNQESFFTDNAMGGITVSAMDIPFAINLLDELTAGNLYLNLHTLDYASGEIRGQLASVPEPASLALLGGLLGLVGLRRRQKLAA